MTTRNLNRTWRDVLFEQYKLDHDADVAFPVRYLLHNPQFSVDLFYEIPVKIHPDDFRRSILAFHRATKHSDRPEYADQNISIRQRFSHRNSASEQIKPDKPVKEKDEAEDEDAE